MIPRLSTYVMLLSGTGMLMLWWLRPSPRQKVEDVWPSAQPVPPSPQPTTELQAAQEQARAETRARALVSRYQSWSELKRQQSTAPGAAPMPNNTPAVPPPPVPAEPRHLSEPSPVVQKGKRYQVVVDVAFPFSMMATDVDVRKQAEEIGFQDVSVSKNRPAGWLGGASGSFYILGRYEGSTKAMERAHLGGQVKISDVWEM